MNKWYFLINYKYVFKFKILYFKFWVWKYIYDLLKNVIYLFWILMSLDICIECLFIVVLDIGVCWYFIVLGNGFGIIVWNWGGIVCYILFFISLL